MASEIRVQDGYEIEADSIGWETVVNPHIALPDHVMVGARIKVLAVSTVVSELHGKEGTVLSVYRNANMRRNEQGILKYIGHSIGFTVIMKDVRHEVTGKRMHFGFNPNEVNVIED